METNEPTPENMSLPLTHEQALPYARQHLWSQRPPTGWVYKLTTGKRVKSGWYFDYHLELANMKTVTYDDVAFGGAPGFLVTDFGEIEIIGHHQLSALFDRKPS